MLLAIFSFIAALRFRKDTPLNQVIAQRYGRPVVPAFRHLQKTRLRRDKLSLDLHFLTTCQCGGVIPKFLLFKVSLQNFNNTKLYRSMLFKCLDFEIRRKEKLLTKLRDEYVREVGQFRNLVSWVDFKILLGKLNKGNNVKLQGIKNTHAKKLNRLGLSSQGGIRASKVIFNLSSRVLTRVEEDVLRLGLQFGLPVPKPKFIDHFLAFEKLFSNLTFNRKKFVGTEQSWANLTNCVKSIANEGFAQRSPNNGRGFDLNRVSALKNLRDDKNVIVSRPDKGKGDTKLT